jgi:hypothetical protein
LLVESTGLVNKDFHTTKKAVLVSGQMKHFLAVLAIVFGAAKLEKTTERAPSARISLARNFRHFRDQTACLLSAGNIV